MSSIQAGGFYIFRWFTKIIQFLLIKSSYPICTWVPPKGICNINENALETAYRKANEYMQFTANDLFVYNEQPIVINYDVKGVRKTVTYFLAEPTNQFQEPILSKEHTMHKWIDIESTKVLVTYPKTGEVVEQFYEFIRSGKATEFKRSKKQKS